MNRSRLFLLIALLIGLLIAPAALAQDEEALVSPIPGGECDTETAPSGDPIVVGGSLSLTGPFGPTGNIHRVVAEMVVNWVNECGGLLGRPVEWLMLDDQTSPEQATANYDRLLTVDNVDLVMGPYGAANILAGAGPVARAGYVYVTHTYGTPDIDLGEYHFPSWQIGGGDPDANPWLLAAEVVFDALESTDAPPENVFYVTNKFPTTVALTQGAQSIGEERGFETLDYVEYDLGSTDFSAIALRISAEDPDFIFMGGIGLDAVNIFDAFETVGYEPRGIYIALPAPGPTMAIGEAVNGAMSLSIFEAHAPFTDDPITAEFIERFTAAATEEQILPIVETQAAASMSAWQTLFYAVQETESLEQDVLQEFLKEAEFDVVAGSISFGGFNGYGTDFSRIIQVQDGQRVLVWPPEVAPEDVSVQYPNE